MRRDVYLKSAQRFAQITMRRMKLMEQYTAEPAVNTSRDEHEARADFAGFAGVSQQRHSRPGIPHTRVITQVTSISSQPQLSNGPILHVSVSMDSRVSQKFEGCITQSDS